MIEASTIWMAVATILLVTECLGADVVGADCDGLLPGAVLALVLALLTSLMALPMAVHAGLFGGLAVVGVVALRRLSGRRDQPSGPASNPGNRARVRQPFNANGQGWVQWRRRLWPAQCVEAGAAPESGAEVRVLGREGRRLLVTGDLDSPSEPQPTTESLSRKTSD
ncbi:MAG: NfeD family protein [Cyanobacteriota bacterium]|nr:NfeD family protein [Cyanobacteriota bacterium]